MLVMKKCISMFLVATARSFVALLALLRVVVVMMVGVGRLAFLFGLGLVSLHDWFRKRFLAFQLVLFDDVYGRNRPNFLLLSS